MFLEKKRHAHYYDLCDADLHIVKFGHTVFDVAKVAPMRIQGFFSIHFILSGNCSFCGQTLSRGAIFIAAPHVPYVFSVSEDYEHFYICFTGHHAKKIFNLFNIPTDGLSYFQLPSEEDYIFANKTLSAAFETNSEKCSLGALLTVLSMLKAPSANVALSHAEKAENFIQDNYDQNISMEDIANFLYISEKHLCRIFKQRYSIPPRHYLLSLRMNKARELILDTDMLIKEIAESVGYISPFTFSEAFSNFFGYPPSELRRKD